MFPMCNDHALGTVAMVLLSFFAGLASGHGAPAADVPAPVPVPANAKPAAATATVTRTSLRQVVRAPARIAAGREIEVKGKVGGQIIEMPIDVGDTVKKGDLLVQLDPTDEQQKVRQAETRLAVEEADLAYAKESLAIAEATLAIELRKATDSLKVAESNAVHERGKTDRMRELLKENLCSQEEFDGAAVATVQVEAALESCRTRMDELKIQERALNLNRQSVKKEAADVACSEIALAMAKDNLQAMRIIAPLDGTITRRAVHAGQIITSASGGPSDGTSLLALADLSRLFAVAPVKEQSIGLIHGGLPAVITVEALPGRRFNGRVVQVAPVGKTKDGAVTFEVKIEILEPDGLKPEMSAAAEIVIDEQKAVVAVPGAAIRNTADGARVEVLRDGKATGRAVQAGRAGERLVEIRNGLTEGEIVRLFAEPVAAAPRPPSLAPAAASLIRFGE